MGEIGIVSCDEMYRGKDHKYCYITGDVCLARGADVYSCPLIPWDIENLMSHHRSWLSYLRIRWRRAVKRRYNELRDSGRLAEIIQANDEELKELVRRLQKEDASDT